MSDDFIRGMKARAVPVVVGQEHTHPQVWVEFDKPPKTRHFVITPQEAQKLGEQFVNASRDAGTIVRTPKK